MGMGAVLGTFPELLGARLGRLSWWSRCLGEPQSWTSDVSERPPATQVKGVHTHPEPQPGHFVLQVRKDSKNKV